MKCILMVSLITLSFGAGAATKSSAAVKPAAVAGQPVASKKNLSKDISFSGSQVDGKFLSAGESVAEIEGEKNMGALIGIRKSFRDRLTIEKARLQAQTSQSAASGKGQ